MSGRYPLSRSIRLAERDASIVSSVELLANYGVSAVRKTRRGELKQLKHVSFGWISAGTFATIQGIKRNVGPLLTKFVEGGYRLKAQLWNTQINLDFLASGLSIPFGVVLVGIAALFYQADTLAGDTASAILDIVCLALPFGELWLLYRTAEWFAPAVNGVIKAVNSPTGQSAEAFLSDPVGWLKSHPFGLVGQDLGLNKFSL